MEKGTPKHDGELIIIADREIFPETPLLATFIDAQSNQKAAMGPAILELLALIEEIKTLSIEVSPSLGKKQLLISKIVQANAWIEVLVEQRQINKKLLETLLEGQINVGLWIDSIGGEVEQEDKVNYALDYLDRQKASVRSYVGVKAASAAFDLTFLADEVNALSRSVFMWHFSDSPEHTRAEKIRQLRGKEDLDEEASEEINDLLEILERAGPEKKELLIAEVLRQINDTRNTDGAVYLEGDYLHDMGLVQKCFRNVSGLIKKFKTDFPLHAELNITYFNSVIAEKVYQKIGHLPNWLGHSPLSLTDKVRRQFERPNSTKRPVV